MRESMWEYITPSSVEKEELWNNCVFVFDTNVLLNLYRYTSNTRDALLFAFDDLKERIWLPHQVAHEFAKNRFDVIYETVERYKKLETLEQELINQYTTELRIKASDKTILQLQESINTWITEQKRRNLLVTHASEDIILERVLDIFSGKVGTAFSNERMDALFVEGKQRYEKQIPPGFCDAKKEKDATDNNAYGDFIVWKQILEYASGSHKNIIFVTHDQKKDWWFFSKGRTVGPRIELRKEFSEETKQQFYMYSIESFLEQYSNHKGQPTDMSVIEEVTQIDRQRIGKLIWMQSAASLEYASSLKSNIAALHSQISRRQRTIEHLRTKYKGYAFPPNVLVQIQNTERKISELQHQLVVKQHELNSIRHGFTGDPATY